MCERELYCDLMIEREMCEQNCGEQCFPEQLFGVYFNVNNKDLRYGHVKWMHWLAYFIVR